MLTTMPAAMTARERRLFIIEPPTFPRHEDETGFISSVTASTVASIVQGQHPRRTALFLLRVAWMLHPAPRLRRLPTFFARDRSHAIIDPEAIKTHVIAP